MKEDEIKGKVKESYGKIARGERSCCSPDDKVGRKEIRTEDDGKTIGYSLDELASVS